MKIKSNSILFKNKGHDRRTVPTTFRMTEESEKKVRHIMKAMKKSKTVVFEEMIDAAYEAVRQAGG